MSDEQTPQNEYPSRYGPGAHWATDAAWQILDTLKPGAISADIRAFLAGMIAGRLMRERDAELIFLNDINALVSQTMGSHGNAWSTVKAVADEVRERIDALQRGEDR